ncbi:MAG: amino acid ABC transporter substrate-binding protein [Thiothrix sp.]|nr:amino acid ABC transporter substrate-binding protein [Thiothrix sp.]HPQ97257.1 amino acid ABC transporter substrate-binding protein [Thiolinea sp.]
MTRHSRTGTGGLSASTLLPCLPLLLALLHASAGIAHAEDTFTIGYLELKGDARYKEKRLFARYLGQPLGRPYAGAEVAIREVRFHGTELGLGFALEKVEAETPAGLQPALEAMQARGIRFVAVDLPAEQLLPLAQSQRGKAVVLFNVSAPEDRLRGEDCQPNLYHTLPSQAMLYDALAQYLVSRKWRNILELTGPEPEDQALSAAFARSARKFGLRISAQRPFELGNDPRDRSRNNIALLSGGDHDAIFVADARGEFARSVPYQTRNPDLIVGSEGLAPMAWHWSWERYGAPQLEKRFEKMHQRPMTGTDWAAWIAIKSVAESVQATRSTDVATISAKMTAPDTLYDNFKGTAGGFRAWDHQLRQPVLLATHNWVVERTPLDGFLHQTNTLDSIGVDERESRCRF